MNDETNTPDTPEAAPGQATPNMDANFDFGSEAPAADPRDEEITRLKAEAADLKDKLLRLAADMDNLRKRSEREKAEATLYAATNFARDLLMSPTTWGAPSRRCRRKAARGRTTPSAT